MKKVLEGGVSQDALGGPCRLRGWEGETQSEEATGGCKTCLTGAQQRTRGAVEASGRVGEEKRGAAVRGSEVLCLRHGGRLREAGEDTQHGPVLSQETLVHPSQALELSQSRESLQRGGGESCREGPADGACREGGREGRKGGRLCAQKDSHRKYQHQQWNI